jgi:hypothetical protein
MLILFCFGLKRKMPVAAEFPAIGVSDTKQRSSASILLTTTTAWRQTACLRTRSHSIRLAHVRRTMSEHSYSTDRRQFMAVRRGACQQEPVGTTCPRYPDWRVLFPNWHVDPRNEGVHGRSTGRNGSCSNAPSPDSLDISNPSIAWGYETSLILPSSSARSSGCGSRAHTFHLRLVLVRWRSFLASQAGERLPPRSEQRSVTFRSDVGQP